MREFIINIVLIDLVIMMTVFMLFAIIKGYKHLFPYKKSGNPYIDEAYNPESTYEEDVYDEGYVNEVMAFEDRIKGIKEELEVNPIEIITDEYEKSTEK